jgi:hypothetical protein
VCQVGNNKGIHIETSCTSESTYKYLSERNIFPTNLYAQYTISVRHVVFHIIKQATANSPNFLCNAYVSNYFGQSAAMQHVLFSLLHTIHQIHPSSTKIPTCLWFEEYQEYISGNKDCRWQSYHIHVPTAVKCGSLNLLEHSGPLHGLL